MTLSPDIEAKIRASFAAQSLMATLGIRINDVGDGQVTLSAPVTAELLQQHDAAHAGLTFAMGDSAAGYAALSQMPEEAEVMTAEMKINLLRPAIGERLVAIGRVIKPGRRLFVVQADVHAIDGDRRLHVALLQGTMVPV